MHIQDQARWVWFESSNPNEPNQYVQFRKECELPAVPVSASLRVCIDTNFAAFVNGQLVGCGQWQDFPDTPKYSEMDIARFLRSGANVIAILGYYCGVDHFSYLPGKARLWFEFRVDNHRVAVSDAETWARKDSCFLPERISRITLQRGFTFHYDARGQDDWREIIYTRRDGWRRADVVDISPAPKARPLPMLTLKPPTAGKITAQGLLRRSEAGEDTIARLIQHDFLSARRSWELFAEFPPVSSPASFPVTVDSATLDGSDGVYLIVDLGREDCGHLLLQLDATGTATLDIAIGEHLDDLRVRSHIGGRNFASRYVAGVGPQEFADYLNRNAGRYIQVHVTKLSGKLTLRQVGLVPAEYPVEEKGTFNCDDSLVNQIWQTARRTLHLCMHEHFEDCPAREQALYANDSRSQMLCNYYAFGDYAFARASLDLLGRSEGVDGYQELCAPMKYPITIPSFTMTWFLAMNDYLLFSGDLAFVAEWLPRMKRMMSCYLGSLSQDLLPCPTGPRYWHFYDWADGLDGTESADCTKFAVLNEERFDAPLNLLFAMALACLGGMAREVGDLSYAQSVEDSLNGLRRAIAATFWSERLGLFLTYLGGERAHHVAELTQSLAILAGVGSDQMHAELRKKIMSPFSRMTPTTLSQSLYKFEALLLDPSCGAYVRDTLIHDWSAPLFAGATSFWETRKGGWDFHHAGSLCHGWSAIPVYLLGAYGLGIRPTKPGFRKAAEKHLIPLSNPRGSVPRFAAP